MRASPKNSQSSSLGERKTDAIGLYLHIPFCVHRCSYCDFYSSAKYSSADFATLTDAILVDLVAAKQSYQQLRGEVPPLTSIFFGGGTPSLLPIPLLTRIFDAMAQHFVLDPAVEITLEANPETVTEAFAADLRRYSPVNRLSLGVQSFRDQHLKALERLGSKSSVESAVARLKGQGFANFNLDFIIGIPGQSIAEFQADLAYASALGASHLSAYTLTLKPAHPLYASLPSGDEGAEIYEALVATVRDLGFARYEVSNFALPGRECLHNQLYWTGGDFLGVGPSASSRVFAGGVFHHRKAVSDFAAYVKQAALPWNWEANSRYQTQLEASFLELRYREGVDSARFFDRYGWDLAASEKFGLFVEQALLEKENGRIKLTDRGFLLADSIGEGLAPRH